MKIYILGADHEIQRGTDRVSTEDIARFKTLLEQIISENDIEFIGEEIVPNIETVAGHIAEQLDLPCEIIEMSAPAREALGIAEEQRHRSVPIFEGGIPVAFGGHVRVLSDGVREEYMVWSSITKAEEVKADSILVLCGLSHAAELRDRFEKYGHTVTLDSLCERPWYSHSQCAELEK